MILPVKKVMLALLLISPLFLKAATGDEKQRLKVFIDCSGTWCDEQYLRSQIRVVDFMLDRLAADVHVLITAQENGNGGSQYQLIFFGQQRFSGRSDTLRYSVAANATGVELREQLARYISFGLVPYLLKCGSENCVQIDLKSGDTGMVAVPAAETKDAWNYWVFRLSADGSLSADQVYKSFFGNGIFSAGRVTDTLKVRFTASYNKMLNIYRYELADSVYEFRNENNNLDCSHLLVRSISSHWSLGYSAGYTHNSFSNMDHHFYFGPGIEYDFFPYSDVSNRYLTLRYGPDVSLNKYIDTTIYDKTNELLFGHSLSSSISFNQKWGSVFAGITWTNYLHDWRLNSLNASLGLDVRITGGLSLNMNVFGGLAHDQVSLQKEGATSEEVLTRRRQLRSGYSIWSNIGISYRFGSKLNNFINPRFE